MTDTVHGDGGDGHASTMATWYTGAGGGSGGNNSGTRTDLAGVTLDITVGAARTAPTGASAGSTGRVVLVVY